MTSERRVGGHPAGLAILSATELAERFSYYGMTALLVLYMTKQLLLPGHAENVVGLSAARSMFEFRGPMSDQAFASLVYGWYGGLVYFTPIVGGWLADRWLGARRTVIVGAVLMAAGHLAMSFDASFLAALALLILGSGCLKGNISAQVGALYPRDAASERQRGFTIFSTGINIGSVAGPLASGTVAAIWGWHAGFALAAAFMLVALAIYVAGQKLLPESGPDVRAERRMMPPLSKVERGRVGALLLVIVIIVPVALSYSMIWNVGIVWVDQRVSLGWVPASWFNSVDSFASIVAAPPLVALWAWQQRRKREPASINKIAIGAGITGASALVLAAGAAFAGAEGEVSVWWALAGYFGMGVGFMYYWPVTLSLISQQAPPRVNATMVSCSFLALFVGTTAMGWVGSFYETMSDAIFWSIDGGIAFISMLAAFILARPLSRHFISTPK